MKLNDKFYLCYVNASDLFAWIKENNLTESSFKVEKNQWKEVVGERPNFFSDSELLMVDKDIVLLKTLNDNHTSFLARTYKLEYQEICQKVFQNKKNIVIISDQQWKEQKSAEKLIVLFKDQENIEKNL
jgi:hypothetical protein